MPDPLRFPVPTSFETPRLLLRPFSLRCGFRLEGVLRHAARSPEGRLRSTRVYARLPGEG